MQIIDGKKISQEIKDEVKEESHLWGFFKGGAE